MFERVGWQRNQGVNLLCREGNSQPGHWRTDPLFLNLRSSEIHLFYNLGDFYWHFLEILWLFIFLFLYSGWLVHLQEPNHGQPRMDY